MPRTKRGLEETGPDISSMNVTDIVLRSQQLGGQDATLATIQEMVRVAGTTYEEVKKFGHPSPSFSAATWQVVAPTLKLKIELGINQFPGFEVAPAFLPRAFLKKVLILTNDWLDVYQEPPAHNREASRVRVLEPWLILVCRLFMGRLVDKPECPMPPTDATSGGQVEHEISMLEEGILLVLIELKLYFKNLNDHVAQVLLELSSAYQKNRDRAFLPQPPVYAVLTDLEKFYFFKYDGSQFFCKRMIFVRSDTREAFLLGMCEVTECLFGILLNSYIEVLTAVQMRFSARAQIGDVSAESSAAPEGKAKKKKSRLAAPRPSTEKWSQALIKAHAARDALADIDSKPTDCEEQAERGLRLLFESVRLLDKFGSVEDWDDESLETKVEDVLSQYRPASRAVFPDPTS